MKTLTQSLALVIALGSAAAFASDVVYKAETDLSVLRTELKYSKTGTAWINLTLEDGATPEGGIPYQTVQQIKVPGLTYDVARGEISYKGTVCSTKRFLGNARLNESCEMSAKIVLKTSYVVDTEGDQHPLSTARFVEVRFGVK